MKKLLLTGILLIATGSALAVLPSTLRSLADSYRALRVGTSVETAVELMGNPKSRADHNFLGVSYADLIWIDIAQIEYQAKFVSNYLVQKSSTSNP